MGERPAHRGINERDAGSSRPAYRGINEKDAGSSRPAYRGINKSNAGSGMDGFGCDCAIDVFVWDCHAAQGFPGKTAANAYNAAGWS